MEPHHEHHQHLPPRLAVPPPKNARRVAKRLLWSLGVIAIASVFAPWRQTVNGAGRVVAFSPNQRTQGVEAPVKGVVAKWYVHEGSHVKAGDPIVDLRDNDQNLMNRLTQERSAVQTKVEAQESKVFTLRDRVESVRRSTRAEIEAALADVEVAEQDVQDATQKVRAVEAKLKVNQLNLDRQLGLQDKGLVSQRDLELAQFSFQQSEADLASAQASLSAARSKLNAKKASLAKARAYADGEVQKAEAALRSAESDAESTKASLAKVEVGISRQAMQTVTAPIDGTILSVMVREGTEQVKQGDTLAILVPDTQDRAVELYVDGLDAALIAPGAPVRLQFEGWPAVQFAGWPSVAVGTFGGKVSFVDASDDGQGNFRAVIVPSEEAEDAWPEARYLRQGVRAKGWFLLREVSLGNELWRRFNGFPPLAEVPERSTLKVKRK